MTYVVPERDWKLLRKNFDSYINLMHSKYLEEIKLLINDDSLINRDKTWKIFDSLKNNFKDLNICTSRLSRSNFMNILAFFYTRGILKNDIDLYSDETKLNIERTLKIFC